MAQYIDSYYLVEHRKPILVKQFLDKYMPNAIESAEDYPVPLYNDSPVTVFYNIETLLFYLEREKECEYAVYWQNLNENQRIKHFMVFHTDDGKMIFGVSVAASKPDDLLSITVFNELKVYLNSEIACITAEEPPPANSQEFVVFSKSRYIP